MKGRSRPRLAPPAPSQSAVKLLVELARRIGIDPFPWQTVAATYVTALTAAGRLLYREVAIIVARQNGKTTLLVPLIVMWLLAGLRIMHTAQNRELPREVFGQVAEIMVKYYPHLLRSKPRFANGQEEIRLLNGGVYRIVAATRGGARGPSNDRVIIDELREMVSHDFVAAAKPTLTASADPLILYLSNAGEDESVVLNALEARSRTDPGLAYLEWSAAPERDPDDRQGWLESNPSIGYLPGMLTNLKAEYRAHDLGGTMAIFEVEHLCRRQRSTRPRAISAKVWATVKLQHPLDGLEGPWALGIGVAPGWERASVAVAGLREDGRIGVEVYRDLPDHPTPATITAAVEQFHVEQPAATIAYDATSGGAGEFQRHADLSALPYDALKPAAMMAATMDGMELIMAGRLAADDPLLDAQVPFVVKRSIGQDGAFRFSRGDSSGPIDAVEAMLLAVQAIARGQSKPNIW